MAQCSVTREREGLEGDHTLITPYAVSSLSTSTALWVGPLFLFGESPIREGGHWDQGPWAHFLCTGVESE